MEGGTLSAFGKLLEELAKAVCMDTEAKIESGGWDKAVFDLRVSPVDGGAMHLIRVRTPSGVQHVRCRSVGDAVESIVSMRREFAPDLWYGLYVIVSRKGKVEVKYDYDLLCIEQFTFDRSFHD